MSARTLIEGLPGDLPGQVLLYLRDRRVPLDRCQRVDVILALLSINTPAALRAAEDLSGRPIQVCPAYVPQWPPLPVQRSGGPRLARVARNPCLPTTAMFQRYRLLRVGATKPQLLAKGVTTRDLRYWERGKHIEWRTA